LQLCVLNILYPPRKTKIPEIILEKNNFRDELVNQARGATRIDTEDRVHFHIQFPVNARSVPLLTTLPFRALNLRREFPVGISTKAESSLLIIGHEKMAVNSPEKVFRPEDAILAQFSAGTLFLPIRRIARGFSL
jgi:hypothetical protein